MSPDTKVYINLPVKDLKKSMDFFTKLGFKFNAQFTNDQAAALIIGEHNFAMLLTEKFFKRFTVKDIANAHRTTEVLIALQTQSRLEVDELLEKAIAAGAQETKPAEDPGFMYGRDFADLDGHIWEFFWMDPEHSQK